MAQRVEVLLLDDIDGETANETITFGLDGTTYEIDLHDKNAGKLRKALEPFVSNARRLNRHGKPTTRTQMGPSPRLIRDWAKANGLTVPERGRVPEEVRAAYAAAH